MGKASVAGALFKSSGVPRSNEAIAKARTGKKQRRNTGISPLRRQNAPPSVEMTFVVGVKENEQQQRQKQIPYGMTNKRQATAKARTKATAKARARARAKTKYRDLSTAAAKCAAFGRDDVYYGLGKEQATAVAMTFVMGLKGNKEL
jgi:hypothetical protein